MANNIEYNYRKVVGFHIDTNQVKNTPLTIEEAKNTIDKIVETYSEGMLHNIRLIDTESNRFTAYTYHYPNNLENNISLHEYLTSK